MDNKVSAYLVNFFFWSSPFRVFLPSFLLAYLIAFCLSACLSCLIAFFFIFPLLLWWMGYIAAFTFTKILTMYQIYHIWIHPLHILLHPLSPDNWKSFNKYHFFIYICVHTLFPRYSSSYPPFPSTLLFPPCWLLPHPLLFLSFFLSFSIGIWNQCCMTK
jgi:hypothetical protein